MYTPKLILAATVLVAAVSLLLSSDSRDPRRRRDIEIIRLTDDNLELLPIPGANGPESIAFDATGGGPYTGVSDGRILKWRGPEGGWLEYASMSSPHL
ncbi:Protein STRICTOSIDINE SYNTHASE-LIKE 8 [Ananas comosus]|uniref:Protein STRICTOSIDINE SYNTHASE-LIKE 8 n=1 Tax=Ananas comosus TaxID=4615 RepID=A0A199V7P5_ANACO|nr:Protein STRICTOSIDINE SYNTHASE-LIKE 8 [Ananas comosus]